MPFLEAYPLRHQGPRTDLSVAYLNAVINNTTVTVNASETTAGYTIARTGLGTFTLTFKRCRFLQIRPKFMPVTGTNGRAVRFLAPLDPTSGTVNFELATTESAAAADAAAENGELELWILSGF